MRTRARFGLVAAALAAAAFSPAATQAQAAATQAQAHGAHAGDHARPAVVDAMIRDIDVLQQKLLGLAEAIPEADYGWRPGEGVRSVSEVMMHVAADNYFIPTIAGATAPAETGIKAGDYASVQAYEARTVTKAEAIAAARASFEHLNGLMAEVDDAALAETLNVFGSSMTGMDLLILTGTHLHEHLGQMIAYARSNGVVPPWSQ